MKFLLALLVALTLTISWHSSVIAAVGMNISADTTMAADEKKKDGKDEEEEEPECD